MRGNDCRVCKWRFQARTIKEHGYFSVAWGASITRMHRFPMCVHVYAYQRFALSVPKLTGLTRPGPELRRILRGEPLSMVRTILKRNISSLGMAWSLTHARFDFGAIVE